MIRPSDSTIAELPDVVRDYIFELEHYFEKSNLAYIRLTRLLSESDEYTAEVQKALELLL